MATQRYLRFNYDDDNDGNNDDDDDDDDDDDKPLFKCQKGFQFITVLIADTKTKTSKNKRYNFPTFRRLHDAIIKSTNDAS